MSGISDNILFLCEEQQYSSFRSRSSSWIKFEDNQLMWQSYYTSKTVTPSLAESSKQFQRTVHNPPDQLKLDPSPHLPHYPSSVFIIVLPNAFRCVFSSFGAAWFVHWISLFPHSRRPTAVGGRRLFIMAAAWKWIGPSFGTPVAVLIYFWQSNEYLCCDWQ